MHRRPASPHCRREFTHSTVRMRLAPVSSFDVCSMSCANMGTTSPSTCCDPGHTLFFSLRMAIVQTVSHDCLHGGVFVSFGTLTRFYPPTEQGMWSSYVVDTSHLLTERSLAHSCDCLACEASRIASEHKAARKGKSAVTVGFFSLRWRYPLSGGQKPFIIFQN